MEISALLGLTKAIWEWGSKIVDWRKSRNQRKEKLLSPSTQIVRRFVDLFEVHGISRSEIPRFLAPTFDLRISDVLDDQRLLELLDERLLNYVCSRFGILRGWLDTGGCGIYPRIMVYKNLRGFVELLDGLLKSESNIEGFCFKTKENKLEKSASNHEPICLFFRAELAILGDKTIYRYYFLDDTWPWGHSPARIELKAVCLLCLQRTVYIRCRNAPRKKIEAVLSGAEFPARLNENSSGAHWHLDDYALLRSESVVAKDEEEALEVRQHLRELGLKLELDRVNS